MIVSKKLDRARDWATLASLLALITLFFGKLLFTNLILARGDILSYIYPYWTAAADALRAGRLPLWNPDLFMGAPLLANSQMGFLYPLNWPLWLLLDVPTAATLSIVLHLCLAAGFCFGFMRSGLGLGRSAGCLAALLFALGGYLTAQIEHVNQLQGLTWLPAVFWLLVRPGKTRRVLLLGAVFGLQLLAGHTQATFITLVGASLFALALSIPHIVQRLGRSQDEPRLLTAHAPLLYLVVAGLIALLLAAAQLLPTLELSRHSMRGGGGLPLNEAVSFSLPPLLLGRTLLPGYGETIFSEYVAFLPLTALLLALIGLWAGRRRPAIIGLVLLAGIGLFFALGAANPLYLLLAKFVPGFSFFRAPSRWLALYAFWMAGLAGMGLDALLKQQLFPRRNLWAVWLASVMLLITWALLAPQLTGHIPSPPEAPVDPPTSITLVGWSVEMLLASLLLLRPRKPLSNITRYLGPIFCVTILLVLFLASRALPYNHPSAPEAYHSLRPAPAYLKAAATFDGDLPPSRFLSISDNLFDPGDMGELQSIYGDRLDAASFRDLITAVKQKEILAPNLSLALGLPTVDGYDGGVLPLANYVALEQLLLPPDAISMDGRLRENLEAIPDGRWLSLFNVRYVITDKVGDAWDQVNGVFYDLQHGANLNAASSAVEVAYVPFFEATGLGLAISHPDLAAGAHLAEVLVQFRDGRALNIEVLLETDAPLLRTAPDGSQVYASYVAWSQPAAPESIVVTWLPSAAPFRIHGLSLVDNRDAAFQNLVISDNGRFRLVYSGDVKIYENLDVQPRAFLVNRATWVDNDQAALDRMAPPDFSPAAEAVLLNSGGEGATSTGSAAGKVIIVEYRPELVRLLVDTPVPGWLILSDAHYPGWEARIDGELVPITRADLLFRAVPVSAEDREVVFEYRPTSVRLGLVISGVSWLGCLLLALRARSDNWPRSRRSE